MSGHSQGEFVFTAFFFPVGGSYFLVLCSPHNFLLKIKFFERYIKVALVVKYPSYLGIVVIAGLLVMLVFSYISKIIP